MGRHYLFTTWDGSGNVPPELSVARGLMSRGHRVTFLGDPTLRADVEPTGAGFIEWRDAPHIVSRRPEDDPYRDYEAKSPPKLIARLSERLMCGPARHHAAETISAARDVGADAVVSDVMLLGAQIGAEAEGLPFAALMSNVYLLPAPGLPPFGTGWRPARGPIGRGRDAAMARLGGRFWNVGLPPVNEARAELGLPPLSSPWEQLSRAERVLVLTSPSFEFPAELPPNTVVAGARLDDPAWVEPWEPPAGDDPLVLVSLSTGPQDQLAVLRKIVQALSGLPVRGVVTTGNAFDPEQVPAPPHVQVLRSAPHTRVLEHASAVVTHGGHGTVIKTLAAGVPQLVVPMGRDQLDNATRVTERGAGLRVKPNASASRIEAAVRRLLEDPSYRQAAQRLGAKLRAETEHDLAVDELEQVPVSRVMSPAHG